MDQIKELEKYKALLDSGAISDEEFGKLKKKLLGLKSDEEKELEMQQERAEALAELERLRAEENAEKEAVAQAEQEQFRLAQAEKDRKNQEIKAKEEQEQYQKTFVAEKAKEQARLEALQEQEQKKKQEQVIKVQQTAKAATGIVGKIICWILTVFCGLIGIFSFVPSESSTLGFSISTGIIFILFAILACPPLSTKLKENEKLSANWKYKKLIVIGLVIVWFICAATLV